MKINSVLIIWRCPLGKMDLLQELIGFCHGKRDKFTTSPPSSPQFSQNMTFSTSVCVRAHVCMCVFASLCVKSKKPQFTKWGSMLWEHTTLPVATFSFCSTDSSLLSKERHRWEAVWFHSALATSLMSMKIWRSGCACVCVCSCVPVWVWMHPWLWVCACTACLERPEDNIGSFLRGLSHVVGDQVSHWPGTSQKRERPEVAGPQACFCHLFPAEITGACHRFWQALYWLSPLLSPGVHF